MTSSSSGGSVGLSFSEQARHTEIADGVGPQFGSTFAPRMVSARWSHDRGWEPLVCRPLTDVVISPAAMVFHYGQAIFEGLKAYRQVDGGVAVFRPAVNAARFRASARRMAMPELPDDMFLAALDMVVSAVYDAVPEHPGSLYLRPFMIATEPRLGSRPSDEYEFMVLTSPVGAYFSGGERGISVRLAGSVPRAFPGGTGAAKCGGNYAASMLTYSQAAAEGFDQVVWLDAVEHRYVEELSGMNVFLVRQTDTGTELITPAVTDTLLSGVTRASLVTLGRELGFEVAERPVAWEWWRDEARAGRLTEAFACGTGAAMAAIGTVSTVDGESWTMGDGGWGPVTSQLREQLVGVQTGRVAAPAGWVHPVAPPDPR